MPLHRLVPRCHTCRLCISFQQSAEAQRRGSLHLGDLREGGGQAGLVPHKDVLQQPSGGQICWETALPRSRFSSIFTEMPMAVNKSSCGFMLQFHACDTGKSSAKQIKEIQLSFMGLVDSAEDRILDCIIASFLSFTVFFSFYWGRKPDRGQEG